MKGTLSVGKLGDLIVLAEDPYQVDETKLQEITVMMTVVNGLVVYDREVKARFNHTSS